MPRRSLTPESDLNPKIAAATKASIAIHLEAARLRAIRHDYIARYRMDFSSWIEEIILWDKHKPNDNPTHYQLDAAVKLIQYRRISMVGPHGLGKCIPADDLVETASGERVRASDLVGQAFAMLALAPDQTRRVQPARATPNGVRRCLTIVTDKGRRITRTDTHPLWADIAPRRWSPDRSANRLRPEGAWIAMRELEVGSAVAVHTGSFPGPAAPIADDEIAAVAYLLGDGDCVADSPRFTNDNPAIIADFTRAVVGIGGAVVPAERITYRATGPLAGGQGGPNSNPVAVALRRAGASGCRSADKRLPGWAWTLDDRQAAHFLSRIFACDGWATCRPRGGSKVDREIGYCTVSEQLARDIQRLLLRLGIQADCVLRTTTWTHNGKLRAGTAWIVGIRTCEAIVAFAERVGIVGKETAVANVAFSAANASSQYQQRWRSHDLPDHLRWERVVKIEEAGYLDTVAIDVSEDHTYLTDFAEHNSAWFAWAVHWFATTRDGAAEFGFEGDWKIRTTAGSWRQLTDFLWPEIRTKWTRRLDWSKIGRPPWESGREVIQTKIVGKSGEAAAAASSDPKLIEGAHANSILYLLDESKAIPAAIFDGVEGAMSGGGSDTGNEAFIAAHSTPGDESGRFFQMHNEREKFAHWWCIPVTFEDTVLAKRNSEEWRVDMERVYGVKNPVYINRVLGKFAKDRSDGIIPASWVEAAMERWREEGTIQNPTLSDSFKPYGDLTALGVDPNDSGEDDAVIAKLYGDWLAPLEYFRSDTNLAEGEEDPGVMAFVDEVLLHTGGKRVRIVVDAIGPGAGVYSRLRQKRSWGVVAFKASERAPESPEQIELAKRADAEKLVDIDVFRNSRSWLWWQGRKALDPSNGRKLALPPDKRLLGDLTEPRWWEGGGGAIEVDSKDDLRKADRLGRSTDAADAFLQALSAHLLSNTVARTIESGPVVTHGVNRWDQRRQSATLAAQGRPQRRGKYDVA